MECGGRAKRRHRFGFTTRRAQVGPRVCDPQRVLFSEVLPLTNRRCIPIPLTPTATLADTHV